MSTYKDKYIKYKNKYLELKYGGGRNFKKNKLPKGFDKGKYISNVRKQRDKIGEKKKRRKKTRSRKKKRRKKTRSRKKTENVDEGCDEIGSIEIKAIEI